MDTPTSLDLKSLADLLNLDDTNTDSDDNYSEFSPSTVNSNPSHPAADIKASQVTESKQNYKLAKYENKNIWSDEEVIDEEEDEIKTKDKPEYEIIYQQNVTPDDVFLQVLCCNSFLFFLSE